MPYCQNFETKGAIGLVTQHEAKSKDLVRVELHPLGHASPGGLELAEWKFNVDPLTICRFEMLLEGYGVSAVLWVQVHGVCAAIALYSSSDLGSGRKAF